MSRPLIAIVHIPPFDEDQSDVAADMRARPERLRELAREIDVDIECIDADAVRAAVPGAEPVTSLFHRSVAIWWIGRIAFLNETRPLVDAVRAHLEKIGAAPPVHDDPECVDEAFNLSRFFPILERAGIPQAETTFLPLSDDDVKLSEESLRPLLATRIEEARISFDAGPVFFRTYYGTLKIASGLNGAFSAEDLAESAARMVTRLRVGQAIGGIAVREVLPIPSRWFHGRRAIVRREFRVFIVFGKPAMWLLAGDHADYQVAKIPLDAMAALAHLEPVQLARMREISERIGAALRVNFLVGDFTVLDDGRVILLETNPGYAAGWFHPAAFLGAYAPCLRRMAGLPALSTSWRLEASQRLGIDLAGAGKTYGLFD